MRETWSFLSPTLTQTEISQQLLSGLHWRDSWSPKDESYSKYYSNDSLTFLIMPGADESLYLFCDIFQKLLGLAQRFLLTFMVPWLWIRITLEFIFSPTSWLRFVILSETFWHILNRTLWNSVKTFMFPGWWTIIILMNPELFFWIWSKFLVYDSVPTKHFHRSQLYFVFVYYHPNMPNWDGRHGKHFSLPA